MFNDSKIANNAAESYHDGKKEWFIRYSCYVQANFNRKPADSDCPANKVPAKAGSLSSSKPEWTPCGADGLYTFLLLSWFSMLSLSHFPHTTYFSPDPLDGQVGNNAGSLGGGLSLMKKVSFLHISNASQPHVWVPEIGMIESLLCCDTLLRIIGK